MGTLLARSIVERASELAQDEDNILWSTAQALEWVNDAQRAVALQRPDSYTTVQSLQLSPGTQQQIAGERLLDVIRNMGEDGLTPGLAVRLVDRGAKDEFEPDWHTETPGTFILEYIYDDRAPRIFYVSPPVHPTTAVFVETTEERAPPGLATLDTAIVLEDTYAPALIEWVCYRFFSRDSEETPEQTRANTHFEKFFALLGKKLDADLAASPKTRAHLA